MVELEGRQSTEYLTTCATLDNDDDNKKKKIIIETN